MNHARTLIYGDTLFYIILMAIEFRIRYEKERISIVERGRQEYAPAPSLKSYVVRHPRAPISVLVDSPIRPSLGWIIPKHERGLIENPPK